MNNFEKIKAMSVHKLTKFIKLLIESHCSEWDKPHTVVPCYKCVIKDLCDRIPNTTYSIKQWLKQESEEE
jgi:hypothetical protein